MSLTSKLQVSKDELITETGMAVANHPLSSNAGLEILKSGGNAVDAAVAMGFVACVVEPMMTSIGGCGFILLHLAAENRNIAIEFSPRAPAAATPTLYQPSTSAIEDIGLRSVRYSENIYGYKSITIPASVAGFCLAQKKYGTLPLEQVLEPAIHYAENGFTVDLFTAFSVAEEMDRIVRFPELASILLNKGFPPKIGSQLVQRDLGQTLRTIARHGPDAFFTGDIGDTIVREVNANGGVLTSKDMARPLVREVEPLEIKYRGFQLLGVQAVNGATTAMETLSILDHLDIEAKDHNTEDALHLFIEATRHAFADRYRFLGDPEFESVPLDGLLSPNYAELLSQQLDLDKASLEEEAGQPWLTYANKTIHDPWVFNHQPPVRRMYQDSCPSPSSSTTHLGVVDKDRNMVSCTHTLVDSFGSLVSCSGTGVVLADGMLWFNPSPGRANSISGWKRPLVNMAPMLVMKNGNPFMTIGAPGGRKIINAVTQVIMNVIDFGMGMQDAIAVPRVDASGASTLYHPELDSEIVERLRARGHRMVVGQENYAQHSFARPVGILIDPQSDRLHGGVDVLRRAEACGY